MDAIPRGQSVRGRQVVPDRLDRRSARAARRLSDAQQSSNREYGVPAVICVRDATQLISTGELVTVDGGFGTVILADAPAT